MFTLRGLCSNSRHDRKFTLETDGTSKPFFKGLSASTIRWNSNQSHWHLDHLRYTTEGFLGKNNYNMSSATFLYVFAVLVFLANVRGAVQRYSKRDQK